MVLLTCFIKSELNKGVEAEDPWNRSSSYFSQPVCLGVENKYTENACDFFQVKNILDILGYMIFLYFYQLKVYKHTKWK